MDSYLIADMHDNGVHKHCTNDVRSNDPWKSCRMAGKVERVHGHDFEGPLWNACGCDEFATD